MNFETVKKNNKTKIIIGIVVLLILTSVVMFVGTRAKYKSVQSIKLASGIVDYKAPDLKLAIKLSEDGVNYTSSSEIPTGNYTFNTEKSKCRIPTSTLNGENAPVDESITIEYVDGKLNFRGVTKNNTKCYMYFDKVQSQTVSSILVGIKSRTDGSYKGNTIPTFTEVATGAETEDNNGIFETNDPMYGENAKTYYWRGAATTNHVIFDNKCWRIVRVNGDGSIRLIYNGGMQLGNTCKGNGENAESVISMTTSYNSSKNSSSYVGWTYTIGSQRPSINVPQTSGIASSSKNVLETWYIDNMSEEAETKVALGKFCNDRNMKDNVDWASSGVYAAYSRIHNGSKIPTLSCSDGDLYFLNVGMIMADEVQYAGASGYSIENMAYYLYNGQYYWTMTPSTWDGYLRESHVFTVYGDDGRLSSTIVSETYPSIRPVINLCSDVTFNAGSDGTQNNPYIVQ